MFLGGGIVKVLDALRDFGVVLWLFSIFQGIGWDVALIGIGVRAIVRAFIIINLLFFDNDGHINLLA